MILLTAHLDDLLKKLPEGANALRGCVERWRAQTGETHELFATVNEHLALDKGESLAAFDAAWARFKTEISTNAKLMAPYELVSAFGLTEKFDQLDVHGRQSLLERLGAFAPSPPPRELSHFERLRDQQERQGLDDSYMAPALRFYLESRRPSARFLSEERIKAAGNLAESRGIDVRSDDALHVQATDADDAVMLACLFAHTRGCDLFRGQAQDWSPEPSILRALLSDRDAINARWVRFRAWAETQPLLSERYDLNELWAIAQHYGLPSHMLDCSLNPRVAAFFATHGTADEPNAPAVIYCVNSVAVTTSHAGGPAFARYYEVTAKVRIIRVPGLFRMDAQQGAFLEIHSSSWTMFFRPDTIRFPRSPVATPTKEHIYPARKSDVEALVEEFFADDGNSLR